MKQILHEFKDYYYLTEEGEIYNSKTKKYLKQNEQHYFRLRTTEEKNKKISLRKLYKMVYNKRFCLDKIENLENEEWKPVERTDQIYWISSKGRVKSLANYEARILKPNLINGYERLDIMQEGSRSSKLVSRLVAAAFLLPPAALDMQLHHKNMIKTDNRKENLEWLTPQEHREVHKKIKEKKEDGKGNTDSSKSKDLNNTQGANK